MLVLERDRWDLADGILCAAFAALGVTLACLLILQIGSAFFYQAFTPEALMWACGHGFRHPLTLSAQMVDFLVQRRLASFDCSSIPADITSGPLGFFFRSQPYLSWAVAGLWRLLGPRQTAILPLVGVLGAAYATGCFVLARLFFGRGLAAIAALGLTLSPVAIGMVFMLRDYSKGPFFLWSIVLLLLAVRADTGRRAALFTAAAGATAGLGYGFRADLAIMLPIGLVFLLVAARLRAGGRAGMLASYVAGYFVLAAPILAIGNGGNVGTLIMQGATEPFRAFLELRPAPYSLGQKYSDELTLSGVAASERPRHPDWDAREPAPYYGFSQAFADSLSNLLEWAPNFPADFAAQAIKGMGWILGFPALVAVSRGEPDPGSALRLASGLVHWQEPVYALFGQKWMPFVGLAGVLAWLSRVAARNLREAWGLAVLLLALAAYPCIQFSTRHIFYLEFIWAFATLSLPAAVWEWRRLRTVLPRVALVAAAVLGSVALAYAGLARIQQQRLITTFSDLLRQPRETVALQRETQSDGSVLLRVPVPSSQAAIVAGPPDSMTPHIAEVGAENDVRAGAERMILVMGGSECLDRAAALGLRYDHRPGIWQPLDGTLTARPGDIVVFPAFYRATQSFAGVVLPPADAECSVRLDRVPLSNDLPAVLTAVLPPDWKSLPLVKRLGSFGVEAAR